MSRAKAKELRSPYDFYATPSWCYENLQIDWTKYKTAHEPCAGDFRIVKFLESKGIKTTWSEIQEEKDFLEWDGYVDLIFTNPPYSIAIEFIEHALPRANTVIMLLRLNFLGAQKRYKFWCENEPDAVFVSSKRPSFTGKGTDATEYAWFIWQKEKLIKPGIYHLKMV